MTENPGGIESFLRNYITKMDRKHVRFDFLCNSYEKTAYEDELSALGSKLYHFTARSKDFRKYRRELRNFFSVHGKEYHGIWVNVCSLANIDYLKYAKKFGIPMRIIHSHNSQNMDSWLRGKIHCWNRRQIRKYATDFWACSESAASWFYTAELAGQVKIIHNAICVEDMKFNREKRMQLRDELGLQENFVIGNVGRLHFQKNQEFILKLFALTVEKIPEARLILIGQGEDREKLEKLAEELKIQRFIIWAGVQQNICQWLSAFDLFLFPSRFEGMPVAALEAQANGLPILASFQALEEACVLNTNCRRLSLDEPIEKWTEQIQDMRHSIREESELILPRFRKQGYDINTEVNRVEQLLCR